MTEKTPSIYQRLHRIQVGLKAPKEKNQNVAYKSRSAEQILEAAKELLEDGEYITLQDEPTIIGDRFYIKAQAEFGFEGTAVIRSSYAREPLDAPLSSFGKPMMQLPQLTGSCVSYARKYALGGLFSIDDSQDDPDKQPEQKPEKQEDKFLDQDKIMVRDITYAAAHCETPEDIVSFNDEWAQAMQALPKGLMPQVEQAIHEQERDIKNGLKLPAPVFKFINVPEAVAYTQKVKSDIGGAKNIGWLVDWWSRNEKMLNAIDVTLSSKKHQENGPILPKIKAAYDAKYKELSNV